MRDNANNSFEIKGVIGGPERTRISDLLRVKHYVHFLFIDGTGTYKHFLDVIIV